MEERIPQPKGLQGPTAIAAPAPRDDDDAPVLVSSGEESSDDGEFEFEFEFPSVSRDSSAATAVPADELFADGRIRAFYPVFGRGAGGCVVHAAGIHDDGTARSAPAAVAPRVRGQLGRLFLEETRARNSSTSSTASSSSSAATDNDDRDQGLEGAAPESYCVWRPGAGGSGSSSASASSSPRPPRKSGSTGSMARWRRISDLVVGRSHSDAREKFLFFATPPSHESAPNKDKPAKPKPTPAAGGTKQPPPATVFDTVTAAHRLAYLAKGAGAGGGGGAVPGGTPRRTFLPYREELVGFFANVNGISRSHQHPF